MASFCEFLESKLGTRQWVVGRRITPNLEAMGYTVVLSRKRYKALEIEWERETYGAPLESMHKAAPEMLAALLGVQQWATEMGIVDDTVDTAIKAATATP